MKNIIVKPDSLLRHFFPLVRKTRRCCWKYHDRMGVRLVISGGAVSFLDAVLNFPEGVGLLYSTRLYWNGPRAYETATSELLALLIGQSRVFLDIGSNVGIYAVYAGVKFPQVTTFAFEPVPVIWAKNRAFHRANRLPEKNVFNLALGECVGPQKIIIPVYTPSLEEEQTATLCQDSWQAHEEKVEEIEIQCSTLDAFTSANPLPDGACCLKIDVENFEAAVLRGGKKFINLRRPWMVCEILPAQKIDPATGHRSNDNSEVIALVQELGYTPFAITADGFFRMTAADFDRPRSVKNFLLAPAERLSAEKISAGISYLDMASVEKLLAQMQ
jgi:FkbM family methyltransferase